MTHPWTAMPAEGALFDTAPPSAAAGLAASAKGALNGAASAVLLPVLRAVAGDVVGGQTLDDAWRVAMRLHAGGLAHTLGFWDTPAYSQDDVVRIYLAAIARVGAGGADGYVSIKPPALRFDRRAARELGRAARAANVRLHCDSHGAHVADLTLAFAEELLVDLPARQVSVTIPGRWARSPADAVRVMRSGVGVRVVKGQWPDPADPQRDLRAGFLSVIDAVAGRPAHVAIASHDAPLVAQAVERMKPAAFELEFIHGLQAQALLDLAREAGAPARIYVPYGKGFVPSALRVLRRNPSVAWDVIRHVVGARAGRA